MAVTLIDDDFEGRGTAWPPGLDGFNTAVTAGVGTGGSYGVATSPADHSGWIQALIAPVGRCGEISADSRAIYSDDFVVGGGLFVFYDAIGHAVFSLLIGVGADHTQVAVSSSLGVAVPPSAVGANPDPTGAYRRIRLRYRLSSLTETTPGVWTPNADGYLAGDVNGVEVVRSGALLVAMALSFTAADANQPSTLRVFPAGDLDNLLYRTGDECAQRLRGSLVAGVTTTVAATRAISFGLDDATHVDRAPGTFTVHGDTVLDGDVMVLGTLTAPGVPGAPLGSSYVTLTADPTLTAERVLTAGPGITLTDGGPGSTLTIASTVGAGHYDCPLSDGHLVAAEIIFASGQCIIVQVPV